MSELRSHTGTKAKRKSIRQFMDDSTAAHTTLSRLGFGSEVRYLLQQAYRIGLHNGKLIRNKSDEDRTPT